MRYEKKQIKKALKNKEYEILYMNVKSLEKFYIGAEYNFALKNISLNYFDVSEVEKSSSEKEIPATVGVPSNSVFNPLLLSPEWCYF